MKYTILYLVVLVPFAALALFGLYLFFFADCDLVKQFWLLTQVPGRCLP